MHFKDNSILFICFPPSLNKKGAAASVLHLLLQQPLYLTILWIADNISPIAERSWYILCPPLGKEVLSGCASQKISLFLYIITNISEISSDFSYLTYGRSVKSKHISYAYFSTEKSNLFISCTKSSNVGCVYTDSVTSPFKLCPIIRFLIPESMPQRFACVENVCLVQ